MTTSSIKFLGLLFAAWFIVLQQLPLGEIQTEYIETFPSIELSKTDLLNENNRQDSYVYVPVSASKTQQSVDLKASAKQAEVYLKDFSHYERHAFRCFMQECLAAFSLFYSRQLVIAYSEQQSQLLWFHPYSIADSLIYRPKFDEFNLHFQYFT